MRRLVAETRLHPAELVLPVFVREGITEPVADLGDAGRRPAHPGLARGRGARGCVEAGLGGIMLFGVPVDQGRARAPAPTTPTASSTSRLRAGARRGRRRPRRHGRPVPRRVHRPRPLRRARRRRLASTTTPRSSGTPRWRSRRPRAGAHVLGLSGMMDGQVGARPRRARRRRLHRHRDPRVRREVRLRALRPVPRGGRSRSLVGRPGDLPAGPGQRDRGAARARARHRRGRRHRHGQAGAARTSTSSRPPRPMSTGAGRGLPDLGGVRADRGGRRAAAGSTASG